jgi:hypothetical protein
MEQEDNKEELNLGYIYIPYIIKTTTDGPSEEYKSFMAEYKKNHKVCPKCGSEKYSSTLAGYIFDHSEKDKYKDRNNCVCFDCGDTHIKHDRVSIEYFNSKKSPSNLNTEILIEDDDEIDESIGSEPYIEVEWTQEKIAEVAAFAKKIREGVSKNIPPKYLDNETE